MAPFSLGLSIGDKMKMLTIPLSKGLNLFLDKAKQTVSVTVVSLLLLASATASATPITGLHVFGDSLSDSGALTFLSPANCPPAPYSGCRFSNGPVWAELLAADLGLSAATVYGGGTNYAIGGQRTDEVLNGQVPLFMALNGGVADPDALYVIWAGPNDLFQSFANPTEAVDNIIDSILGLSAAGAVDFLIPNVPIANLWAFEFNSRLAIGLDALDAGGLNITQFDAFSTFLDITLNPGDYGLTNVTDSCLTSTSLCANPDEYLLWDTVHPTAIGHQIIAAAALAALSVSEPAILAIFGIGLVGLVRLRRKNIA
jgi:phospholipase/lecithinase/hemolysin